MATGHESMLAAAQCSKRWRCRPRARCGPWWNASGFGNGCRTEVVMETEGGGVAHMSLRRVALTLKKLRAVIFVLLEASALTPATAATIAIATAASSVAATRRAIPIDKLYKTNFTSTMRAPGGKNVTTSRLHERHHQRARGFGETPGSLILIRCIEFNRSPNATVFVEDVLSDGLIADTWS